MRRTNLLPLALLIVTLPAIGKLGFELWRVLAIEAQGAMDTDVVIFFTVARGMLQGLQPYVELFESKPPGIFLLSAASLLLSGDQWPMTILSVSLFVAFPLVIAYSAWHRDGARHFVLTPWSGVAIASALLFALLLTLYLEERAGTMLTEFWGGVFGAFYAVSIARRPPEGVRYPPALLPTLRYLTPPALFLFLSIGMKEPFVVTTFAAAVLLMRRPKDLLWTFFIPLAIAVVFGILALIALGLLQPYVEFYLPAMVLGRVSAEPLEPLLVRGFMVGRVLGNLTTYYPTAPLLGYAFGALWLSVPVLKAPRVNPLTAVLSALHLWLLFELLKSIGILIVFAIAAQGGVPLNATFLEKTLIFGVLELVGVSVLTFILYRRHAPIEAVSALLALYLVSITVGLAGYVGNHFAFAVPFYVALILLFARHVASVNRSILVTIVAPMIAIATTFGYTANAKHLERLHEKTQYTQEAQADFAGRLDALMDRCELDRYFGLEVFEKLGFARHSPVGPLPIPTFFPFVPIEHPLFQRTYANIREQADIVLKHAGPITDPYNVPIAAILEENFTQKPPACAKEFLPIEGFEVWFREA